MIWGDLWGGLADLLFPQARSCPLCAGGAGEVCARCRESLTSLCKGAFRCKVCGRFTVVSLPGLCAECPARRWPFILNRVSFPYEGSARQAVHLLKFGGRRSLADFMAQQMLKTLNEEESIRDSDFLVPIPMDRQRLRERGFNQAELLARALGELSGIAWADPLRRRTAARPQVSLSRAERRRNMTGVFEVKPDSVDLIRGRSIIVVDDVFTTGSTMAAAARALKKAGSGPVTGLCFAGGYR